jgi:hypothetical protein
MAARTFEELFRGELRAVMPDVPYEEMSGT